MIACTDCNKPESTACEAQHVIKVKFLIYELSCPIK